MARAAQGVEKQGWDAALGEGPVVAVGCIGALLDGGQQVQAVVQRLEGLVQLWVGFGADSHELRAGAGNVKVEHMADAAQINDAGHGADEGKAAVQASFLGAEGYEQDGVP